MSVESLAKRLQRLEQQRQVDHPAIVVVFGEGTKSGFVLVPGLDNRPFANQQELDAILSELGQ